MDSALVLPWIVGTGLCLLGFCKWPRAPIELMKPRFVFPLSIWIGVFAQVLAHAADESPSDRFSRARNWYSEEALWYTTLCVCGFWAGHLLPLGRRLARPLASLEQAIRVDRSRLRPIGVVTCLANGALFFVVFGSRAFGIDSSWTLIEDRPSTFVTIILTATSIVGPLIVGFCWPEKRERALWSNAFYLTLVLLSCLHLLAVFSRGAGLPMLLAAATFCVRRGKLSWQLLGAIVWCMLCAHAGLAGRAVHGHYAGLYAFADFMFNETIGGSDNFVLVAMSAVDELTPLCVQINADLVTDVRLLDPTSWLLAQLPVPRFLGITPDATADYTLYLGGYQSWGYTVSFLGDTHGHLGNYGALVFVIWGILYRIIGELAFVDEEWSGDRLRPYVILLFNSYGALAMGIFLSNRPMVVLFFFPAYVCIAALAFYRFVIARPQRSASAPAVGSP